MEREYIEVQCAQCHTEIWVPSTAIEPDFCNDRCEDQFKGQQEAWADKGEGK